MKVHYGVENIEINRPVLTIGSFDGVHLGHLSVIEHLKEKARQMGGESVIISFEPHPREVLYPMEKKPGILTTLPEKISILERCGIDHLIILEFTRELSELSYAEFVELILIGRIGIKALVVGYDHRFGKDRTGNFENLQQLSRKYHFLLEQEKVFVTEHVNVSSTKIRNALAIGDIRQVNLFLGYPYSVTGEVIEGHRLGRKLGFPTANLQVDNERKLLPANGVYVVRVKVGEEVYSGMLNIGIRPTVSNDGRTSLEVHLFDFARDIYRQVLTVDFVARLRGEQKFDGVDELKEQLERDKKEAVRLLQEGHSR
ncbi:MULTISPECIES: bifunctional riboflavin kinase/FAD synthetase [Sanguibacteroides]|uniref:Riboflavin biosynthesis protein n=1 Tax=Sanguibacteroides justesenii TaxID=1547597 RepID=A0A0C3MD81_9PORP|nr:MULTISPECIES: bifunctional riboflavin kinase/FAD synthetase [Sanguibacteroides]KIO44343.1 riboflavin biosynthesis protein RibF [Sanguibacteroides justesenii]KIO45400.1 riboflavin biosynthesis protein RibF [Sanguibacteroides justesenii]PXZ44685.1 bifunctional riboflavin kinase/FAD synthetase [Sanguibacteroides justesenii]